MKEALGRCTGGHRDEGGTVGGKCAVVKGLPYLSKPSITFFSPC